jgi:predicted Ser/Thr protein kinase
MGCVFKARQPQLDRFVALKILPQGLARDPAFAERFSREARVLAKLNHPNIVTIFDFGQANGWFFLLMEFVDGVSLRDAMKLGQTSTQALEIIPKICDALHFAHGEGILHRDIKPDNILLDARGRVKIADFGIAKILGGEAVVEPTPSATTRQPYLTGIVGTPNYMAPEQLDRPTEVDQRSDIYSLGVVFYEMLTGELPIGRFEPPSRKSKVDPRLDDVVLRSLQKDPSRRQKDADELKTQVETIAKSAIASREDAWLKLHEYNFRSRQSIFGLPLVHVAWGIDATTKRLRVAKGLVAVGPRAIGLVAIGLDAYGVFACGLLAVGLVPVALFALGLEAVGLIGIGWHAVGLVTVAHSATAYLEFHSLTLLSVAVLFALLFSRIIRSTISNSFHTAALLNASTSASTPHVSFWRRFAFLLFGLSMIPVTLALAGIVDVIAVPALSRARHRATLQARAKNPKYSEPTALFSPVSDPSLGDSGYELIGTLAKPGYAVLATFEFVDEQHHTAHSIPQLSFYLGSRESEMNVTGIATWRIEHLPRDNGWLVALKAQCGSNVLHQRVRHVANMPDAKVITWRAIHGERSFWIGPGEWAERKWNSIPLFEGLDEHHKVVATARIQLLACPMRPHTTAGWSATLWHTGDWKKDEILKGALENSVPTE